MKQNSLHCQPKLFRIRLSQNSSKWPQICIVSYPCKNGQFHDSCQKSTILIPLLLRLRQGHSTLLLPELLLALCFFATKQRWLEKMQFRTLLLELWRYWKLRRFRKVFWFWWVLAGFGFGELREIFGSFAPTTVRRGTSHLSLWWF